MTTRSTSCPPSLVITDYFEPKQAEGRVLTARRNSTMGGKCGAPVKKKEHNREQEHTSACAWPLWSVLICMLFTVLSNEGATQQLGRPEGDVSGDGGRSPAAHSDQALALDEAKACAGPSRPCRKTVQKMRRERQGRGGGRRVPSRALMARFACIAARARAKPKRIMQWHEAESALWPPRDTGS